MHRILLVEDNEMNRDMLTWRLQRQGFSVCCAVDGAAGVVMAASESPDLILMNVALGKMDRWKATQLIKANPATAAIPTDGSCAGQRSRQERRSRLLRFRYQPVDLQRLLGNMRALLPPSRQRDAVA
jgi:CheY-like chemotaxis protein